MAGYCVPPLRSLLHGPYAETKLYDLASNTNSPPRSRCYRLSSAVPPEPTWHAVACRARSFCHDPRLPASLELNPSPASRISTNLHWFLPKPAFGLTLLQAQHGASDELQTAPTSAMLRAGCPPGVLRAGRPERWAGHR